VRSLSGEVEHLLSFSSVVLRTVKGEAVYRVEAAAPAAGGSVALLKFTGIESPEAARELAGAELLVDRAQAVPLSKDEYYIEDLKALTVLLESGETVAVVTDVVEGGGGWLVEARLEDGSTRLIPFRHEFFGEVSLDERRIVLLKSWILE
jgi:16S rRNA processing protein RimM